MWDFLFLGLTRPKAPPILWTVRGVTPQKRYCEWSSSVECTACSATPPSTADTLIGLVILVLVFGPLLWQLPRIFWPVRLDSSGTRFTGLYRRYSIETFTGYASGIRTWTGATLNTGSVSATATGQMIGGSFTGSATVSDTRRTFTTEHTGFFLEDEAGVVREVDAASVSPAIWDGHLVSAAWLVHNHKPGNAFLVYNHTTGSVYLESTPRGGLNARRGFVKMVFTLPFLYQALLWIAIVTIPVMLLFVLGVAGQLWWFGKRGVRPLMAVLERRAAEMPSRRLSAGTIDLASQVKELTALHHSGSLTSDEFQAAKAKLLEPPR